jgi:hypothetical protein
MLIISGVLIALSISTWWFQRVAFSPAADADRAHAILDDPDIRAEVATVIASADAPTLGQSPTQLKEFIEQITALRAGSALMSEVVADAHARLIGNLDTPVRISGPVQVTIVRDERVAALAAVTVPVQEVGSLSVLNTLVGWVTLVCGALGILALAAGTVMRPERGEPALAMATAFGSLSILLLVLGYLFPLVAMPALSETTWMGVFPQLANYYRTLTIVFAVTSGAIAVGLRYMSGSLRQRRQSSTPLSVGRYSGQHGWSR